MGTAPWAVIVMLTRAASEARKKQDLLLQSSESKRAFHGQKAEFLGIEEKLMDCINGKRQFGCPVSTEMCQPKALALVKEMEI
jgi:hypothetical protein